MGRFPAYSLIKAFLIYFFPWSHVLSFIFIYSLFLSIPLPYLSQPPSALALFPGTGQHPLLPSDGRAGRCPDSSRCLSLSGVDAAPGHAAFSFLPPLEGIPSLSSPFPCYGRGGRLDRCRFLATLGAPRSAEPPAEVADTSSSLHAGCPEETPLSLLPWGIFETRAPWAASREPGAENRHQGGSFRGGNRPAR